MWVHTRSIVIACLVFALASTALRAQSPGAAASDADAIQATFKAAEQALAAGRYDEAERLYDEVRKRAPTLAEAHAKLGVTYYQEGKFAEAVPVLRKALTLKPGLPNLDALLAMSLSELGRDEEALPGLKKAFARTTDLPLQRLVGLHLQRVYTGLGRDADAVGVALELSRRFPDDAEVLYHTGRLFANYAYLQTMKLSRVAPDSVWMHQAAGEANESQGLWDAAIKEYRQVVAVAPRRPGLHFRIGRVLLAQAQQPDADAGSLTSQAQQEFEAELQLDPTNANAAYELGEIQRKAGQLEKAAEAFGVAVKAYPEFEEALVGLGRTLTALGHADAAIELLQKATTLSPDDDVAFYQLAQAYRAVGNAAGQQQALDTFQRVHAARRGTTPPSRQDVTRQELPPNPQ